MRNTKSRLQARSNYVSGSGGKPAPSSKSRILLLTKFLERQDLVFDRRSSSTAGTYIVLEEEQERVAWLQTKCRSGSTASCNAKRAGSTYRVQCEACGLNLPATADVSSAMGLTRRLAAEVVLAGLVYWRHERGERRQSP